MKKVILVWIGKLVALIIKATNVGAGSTWPGHLALKIEPRILSLLAKQLKKGVILIAGTNGKTTTAKMINQIITKLKTQNSKLKTIRNESGANLLNGMVSALIDSANWQGKINADWAIFETDEATLPLVMQKITPKIVIFLNLFRDQLDRYGEVDLIAKMWQRSLSKLTDETTVILNADDPLVAYLGKDLKVRVSYFGLEEPGLFLEKIEHAVDSIYCPSCSNKLIFEGVYFSHLGSWRCPVCGLSRPKITLSSWDYPLPGVYNRYNTLAAVLTAKNIGLNEQEIKQALIDFKPAFGRQEELVIDNKKVRILLSKNPAGFNESLRTLKEFPGDKKNLLLVLNDRIPDGTDVSWIWDVDFEMLGEAKQVWVSGDRVYDLAVRLKYGGFDDKKIQISGNLREAIKNSLRGIKEEETLYILPTYSAMLEVREILGGRKLL